MDRIYHLLAEHWHLSQAQYYHLHLLSSVLLGPSLGVLLLLLFWRARQKIAVRPAV
ncbi:hypothetical protein GKZ68_05885 [Hymenobacter sp. BRD128]|uniref:hypothetical protein n=1 Tax=Hymenobacter sp. BRD128 TaxID=2675878 RepID=UPI001566C70E|nr:hypothetical protein [Hymenobacter sp. BRD128]QKG56213.1 hypothetical protein GKZ68_05885 [Hymenobacter sp. BRD128]